MKCQKVSKFIFQFFRDLGANFLGIAMPTEVPNLAIFQPIFCLLVGIVN